MHVRSDPELFQNLYVHIHVLYVPFEFVLQFHPFSTNEIGGFLMPGRREIGHGKSDIIATMQLTPQSLCMVYSHCSPICIRNAGRAGIPPCSPSSVSLHHPSYLTGAGLQWYLSLLSSHSLLPSIPPPISSHS